MRILNKIELLFMVIALTGLQVSATSESPVIAGCSEDKFIIGGDVNNIVTQGTAYTPKCLKVKVGAVVSIKGSVSHPLFAMESIDNKENPFASSEAATSVQTRIMSVPGVYGYYCNFHGISSGGGMAGVIVVE